MADKILSPGERNVLPQKWIDNEDGSYSLQVSTLGGGGGGGADRELIVETYQANKAFTGASLSDLITATRMIDVTGANPVQVGTTAWFNETTQLALAGAPLRADIDLAGGGGGATNAQIVAALATQTAALNGTIGATNSAVADNDTTAAGLNGLLRGIWRAIGGIDTSSPATNENTFTGISGLIRGMWRDWKARGNAAGNFVQGNVASGVADAGNPVKVGGRHALTALNLTDGQRSDLTTSLRGALIVTPDFSTNPLGDITPNTAALLQAERQGFERLPVAGSMSYDPGTTNWYRTRGNAQGDYVQGSVAAAATDAGNPVKIGGVMSTADPAYANGQRGDVQIATHGAVMTTTAVTATGSSDGISADTATFAAKKNGSNMMPSFAMHFFNGTTWDRVRGTAAGGMIVNGNVAATVADTGAPVKVGGVYTTGAVSLVSGTRGNMAISKRSAVITTVDVENVLTDAAPNAYFQQTRNGSDMLIGGVNYVFNGATYDRQRGDTNGIFVQGVAAFPVFTKPVTAITATALFTALAAVAPGANTTGVALRKTFTASGLTTAGAGTAQVIFEGAQDNSATIWEEFGRADLVLGTTAIAESFSSEDRFRVVRARLAAITGTGATASASMTY